MALYETIQEFPAGVCITGCRLSPQNVVGVQTSAFTFKRQTQVFPGQRWQLELDFLPMKREEAATLEAFLLSLRGGAGRFWMGDPFHSLPQGRAIGEPVVLVAVAGSEEVTVNGFLPNVADQLKPNDKIQIGNHLYSVLGNVDSDSNGAATIKLFPTLRESYSTGESVITRNARGVFSLVGDPTFDRNQIAMHNTSLQAVEAL